MNEHIPVLIVGAGPTGLLMACELRRHNIHSRIIDKRLERTKTSNALGIQARTLELLDDLGIIKPFLQKGLKMDAIEMRDHQKILANLSFSSIESHYNYGLILPQNETEAILEDHLRTQGIIVERDLECTDLIFKEKQTTLFISDREKNEKSIHCDWLIACDGAHSVIREKAKISFIGKNLTGHFGMADADLIKAPEKAVPTNFISSYGAFLGFPIKGKRWRIVGEISPDHPKEISEQTLCDMAKQCSGGILELGQIHWRSTFRIRSKVIQSMRYHNVFFAGDAAHVHSPAGGQGMNAGLQDAYNLAWKLAAVIQQKANESLLDSYHAERHPVIKAIVKETEKMTSLSSKQHRLRKLFFKLALRLISHFKSIQHRFAMRISQLSIAYEKSPIIDYKTNVNKKAPQPGEKAIDITVSKDLRLADLWRGPRYTLLVFSGTQPDQETQRALTDFVSWAKNQYASKMNIAFISSQYIEGALQTADENLAAHKRYHATKPSVYLIRPDKYIAYCKKALDKESLVAELLLQS